LRSLLLILMLAGCGEPRGPLAEPEAVFAWLESGEYHGFESETAVLPGLVHGGRKVFLNGAAIDAIRADQRADVGAIGVRELYAEDFKTLEGWAVVMKSERGWYYYETFDLADPVGHSVAGFGAPSCAGCHEQAPDVVNSVWPLR
jgi:hypothetical protein